MKKFSFHNIDRSRFVLACLFIAFTIILFRLFQIQVLNFTRYKSLAREQHWNTYTIPGKRGTILTNDSYPIAFSTPYYYLYLPALEDEAKKDPIKILVKLKELGLISQERSDVLYGELHANSNKNIKINYPFTWEQKDTISKVLGYDLEFDLEYKRSYPEERMLSHVLGFVGKNKTGEEIGYYGLEQYYDGYLKGHDGQIVREKTASGDPILFANSETTYAQDGNTIFLTIDRNMQFILEKHLNEGVDNYNAKSGVGIIVDSRTGQIRAMAVAPNFDPLFKDDEFNADIVRNDAISVLYEPGSVIKAITMASAIDMGAVTPETTVVDSGTRFYSGYEIDNWDGKHHGTIDMTQVLQLSNNIGISWVGLQVGPENLMKYFGQFGLGQKSGIDLEGEEKGIMYPESNLKDIELVNASFGQGISVTPLQVVMSFAAVANDGKLMRPYVVSKIETKDKTVENQPQMIGRPISERTSKIMQGMLTKAVSGGEAKYFISKKYDIAGKTGTAQVPVSGGYDEYRTNATFVGFFTSYPEFVMLVKLEEPTSPSGYAAETAVPLWMKVAEEIAIYQGLKPDKN